MDKLEELKQKLAQKDREKNQAKQARNAALKQRRQAYLDRFKALELEKDYQFLCIWGDGIITNGEDRFYQALAQHFKVERFEDLSESGQSRYITLEAAAHHCSLLWAQIDWQL